MAIHVHHDIEIRELWRKGYDIAYVALAQMTSDIYIYILYVLNLNRSRPTQVIYISGEDIYIAYIVTDMANPYVVEGQNCGASAACAANRKENDANCGRKAVTFPSGPALLMI